MPSLVGTALGYAKSYGWAVHPLNLDKKPTTEHGFKDATTDEPTIKAFFRNGEQIGIATGAASGLFVLDIDLDPERGINGYETLAYFETTYGALPPTPCQKTGRGGTQYLFKHVEGLKNTTSKIGAGIDTRGQGGYIVVAPSRSKYGPYAWIVSPQDVPLADVPQWLIDLLREAETARPSGGTVNGSERTYCLKMLGRAVANVATASDGQKHDVLLKMATWMGGFVPTLTELEIGSALFAAIELRAEDHAGARKTIQDGIAYGKTKPLAVPPLRETVNRRTGEIAEERPLKVLDQKFIMDCLGRAEAGDAEIIQALFEGQLGYDTSAKAWYAFKDHAWTRREDVPRRMVWSLVASYYLEAAVTFMRAADEDDAKSKKVYAALNERARQLRTLARINNVLTLAQELLPIDSARWDADPWLLGVPNGVLDLRNGTIRDGKPEDYIRTVAPTAWAGLHTPAPRWERFLGEVLSDEQERVDFLRRLLGYALNGSTQEHVVSFFVGARGRNGKRVLFETLQHTLGDYAQSVSTDVVVGQHARRYVGGAQPHLMELQGKRLAYCSETQDGDSISAAQVKNISGGDPITARWLNENPVTFTPTHTLFLQTNRKPQAPADDDALWERVKVVEFKVRFVEEPTADDERPRDPNLEADLRGEAPGILAWLVRGGIEWLECKGLKTPASVKLARDTYRREESIEPFLEAACIEQALLSAEGSQLYSVYEAWCAAEGLRKKSQTWFGKQLSQRYEKGKNNVNRAVYYGLGIEITEFGSTAPAETAQNDKTPVCSNGTPQSVDSDLFPEEVDEGLEGVQFDLQFKAGLDFSHVDQYTSPFNPFNPFKEKEVSRVSADETEQKQLFDAQGTIERITALKVERTALYDIYIQLGGDARRTLTLDELQQEVARLRAERKP